MWTTGPAGSTRFNSRTLGRVRLYRLLVLLEVGLFQFTHPGKGATLNFFEALCSLHVSIHAPWEGCDMPSIAEKFAQRCFNSRTLGRVRLNFSRNVLIFRTFQFTHPGKGATFYR